MRAYTARYSFRQAHGSLSGVACLIDAEFDVNLDWMLMKVPSCWQAWGIRHKDLLHMDNTVQMHKTVPSPRRWRAITIKHDHWRQRTYVPVAAGA